MEDVRTDKTAANRANTDMEKSVFARFAAAPGIVITVLGIKL